LILIVVGFLSAGCSVPVRHSQRPYEVAGSDRSSREHAPRAHAVRLPWEIWPLGRDLAGRELRNQSILNADDLTNAGRKTEALKAYEKIPAARLPSDEQELVALRIASSYLALKDFSKSLSTVSSYFRRSGRGEDSVNAYFSVVLGYGYALSGDSEQSLAWFARASRLAQGSRLILDPVDDGTSFVLRSLPVDRFEETAKVWAPDPLVAQRIGIERQRRSRGGPIMARADLVESLYETPQPVPFNGASDPGSLTSPNFGQPFSVAVVLPLSGKYSVLGKSARNGIELAFAAEDSKSVHPIFKDDLGDSVVAMQSLRDAVGSENAQAVLGPLLSEVAETASAAARDLRVPMITFSKKELVPTGRGVFRLGATNGSQVRSLLTGVGRSLRISKIAMIYPDDPAGQELAAAFRVGVQEQGMQLVFESSFRRVEPDALVALAPRVEAAKPEAVFFADNLLEASRFFTALTPSARAEIVPLGVGIWDNPQQLSRSRVALDGAIFISPFFVDSPRPIVAKFRDAYLQRYRERPDFLAAQAFDAATILLAARRQAVAQQRGIAEALAAIEGYEGLTGMIAVSPDGDLRRDFVVLRLKDGGLSELTAEATPQYEARGNSVVSY
jgi:branched-chain amino acid transport system substrate-binding protein